MKNNDLENKEFFEKCNLIYKDKELVFETYTEFQQNIINRDVEKFKSFLLERGKLNIEQKILIKVNSSKSNKISAKESEHKMLQELFKENKAVEKLFNEFNLKLLKIE